MLVAPPGGLFLALPVNESVGGLHFNRYRVHNNLQISEFLNWCEYVGIVRNSESIHLEKDHPVHMNGWQI